MSGKKILSSTSKEMLIIIISAFTCTIIMSFWDAFERLYLFSRLIETTSFDEFSVFFPSFLAMGFVIYSYRKIKELELEIERRKKVEAALLQSENQYKELSITDDLTKLYNARHFSFRLKKELDRVARYDLKLSLLLIDVDDFKQYNDTFGHFEGDKVLAKLGQVITDSLRRTDSAFRYGGEEFTVILPETDEKEALIVAERMRKGFESEMLHLQPNEMACCTISIGVTPHAPKEEIPTLINRVDKAMYEAKKRGKNRVHLFQLDF